VVSFFMKLLDSSSTGVTSSPAAKSPPPSSRLRFLSSACCRTLLTPNARFCVELLSRSFRSAFGRDHALDELDEGAHIERLPPLVLCAHRVQCRRVERRQPKQLKRLAHLLPRQRAVPVGVARLEGTQIGDDVGELRH
jgi:hypothetical protein